MDSQKFKLIRSRLGKTQKALAQLLGISVKAIHSYEQGWRKIPHHVERQLLFLLSRLVSREQGDQKCWDIRQCPEEQQEGCPAREFDTGDLCWFINGTNCSGKAHQSWEDKMEECRTCHVFSTFLAMNKESLPMNEFIMDPGACQTDRDTLSEQRKALPGAITEIMNSLEDDACFAHIGDEPIHFSTSVREMIDKLREILFPGYFSKEKVDGANLPYHMGQAVSRLYDILSQQVIHVLRHDCLRYDLTCTECEPRGSEVALEVIRAIPELRRLLAEDVRGAYDGDPAAKSHDEVIFSYPGLYAITVYRVANILHRLKVPQLPRIMSEYAHSLTGIDIHPGATIGRRFVIDHGTGIVIGETSVIGNNVRIYQNVTIGALSLPPDAGEKLRWAKRHPTIEDDVIVYSGATILGGDTVIGARSVVGGNVWLTHSIPADTKVFIKDPKLVYKNQEKENPHASIK